MKTNVIGATKTFKRILTVGVAVMALALASGCTTMEDRKFMVEAQKEVLVAEAARDKAKYDAEAVRYKAIAFTSNGGDATSRVAAAMSLQKGGNTSTEVASKQGSSVINTGPSTAEQIFMWTDMLLNRGTAYYGINKNTQLGITQSNNARMLGESTNNTFLGLGKEIKPNYSNSFNTTTMMAPAAPAATTEAAPVE